MLTATKKALVISSDAGQKLNVLGHAITAKLTSQETDGDNYVFEVVSPPGAGIPPHVHQQEDEVIYIADGVYEIFLNGEIYQAQPGDWLHFPRFIPHGFQNVGIKPGRTLWVVTPGGNFEEFFAELGALPADQPPDMAKVVEIFGRYDIEILPPPG